MGKTTLILKIVHELQKKHLGIAGLVSPGIFDGEQKVAIELVDLTSWESRLLARLTAEEETDLRFGDWSFSEETLQWGNQMLAHLPKRDVLVLDEIGPLELDLNQGLRKGLQTLAEHEFQLGLITLRPRCVERVVGLFPDIELFSMDLLDAKLIEKQIIRIAKNLTPGLA